MSYFKVVEYVAAIDGEKLDNFISFGTGLFPCNWGTRGYSHVELWFPDKDGKFYDENGNIVGVCFSSTTRGNSTGVRFEPANIVLRHPERWEEVTMQVPGHVMDRVLARLFKEVGKEYDFDGLQKFIFFWKKDDPNKWYCSEIIAWALYLFGRFEKRYAPISPRRVSKIIEKKLNMTYKFKPLKYKKVA